MAPYDLAILGAGPAGSAAAVTAARSGLRVCLIDKARFPRDKLCGGLFTGRARMQYAGIFHRDLDPDLFEPRQRIAFFLGGASMGQVDEAPTLFLTMRRPMDAHLLEMAEAAGATLLTGTRVSRIDLEKKRLHLAGGPGVTFRVLIGADGVNSAVARALFGRSHDPDKIGFALEKEMPPETDPLAAGTVRVDFGAANWGYGWSFPKRRSTTVGVGGVHALNPDMKARLHAYGAVLGQADMAGMKGHFIPFGDFQRQPGRGAVLLAGDAAGFVDPITGEGIAHALDSGRQAALAAAEAIRAGAPERAAALYQARTRDIRRGLEIARLLRPILFAERMAPVFRRSFAGSERLRTAYLRLLAGELEYTDLLWLTARRLPRLFLRAVRRPKPGPA